MGDGRWERITTDLDFGARRARHELGNLAEVDAAEQRAGQTGVREDGFGCLVVGAPSQTNRVRFILREWMRRICNLAFSLGAGNSI